MTSRARRQQRGDPAAAEGKVLTILEHLQELRQRLIISAAALILGTVASAIFTQQLLEWLTQPAKDQVKDLSIVYTEPLEYWGTYFRVALVGGVALAMPIIVYELLAFVGPGLTRQERRWVYPIVLGASLSFLGGAAFAYYVELPPALRFLLGFSGDVATPFIKIGSYINFVTRLMMVTGLVFELPLVVMGLAKLGVVTSRRLLGWWRYALVLAFVVAAVVTPSIDPVTQSLVAAPIIVLYFAGIVLAKLVESRPVVPRSRA
jgi:sec-independent protein translocase protein TatC